MEPGDVLRAGRRAVTEVEEFDLLEDLHWHPREKKWILRFKLNLGRDVHEHIPATTNWYATISDEYPHGQIEIFPDKQGGITATFPHQSFNSPGSDRIPWRQGLICVDVPENIWGRTELRTEQAKPEERLKWHILRAVDWLKAAGQGTLQVPGDPFELPPFPKEEPQLLAFNENETTFQQWQTTNNKFGIVDLLQMPVIADIKVSQSFWAGKDNIVPQWGTLIGKATAKEKGIWIMLPQMPVCPPWQIPETWDQLIGICNTMGLDIKKQVQKLLLKYYKEYPKLLMLGFPISKINSGPVTLIHWFSIKIESFPKSRGFGTVEAYIDHATKALLATGRRIPWVTTRNWDKAQISARGVVIPQLQDAKIMMIGVGAIGSTLAESLLRLGCGDLTLVDPDMIEIGNLCRHTLTMTSIGRPKAEEVAKRMNTIFPNANVKHYAKSVQELMASEPEIFNNADIIIDATGSDEVLLTISKAEKDNAKKIVSISTNINADRLFCYVANWSSPEDSVKIFFDKIKPWLQVDKQHLGSIKLPQAYVGCWHPLSPARLDDLQMLTHAIIKPLEKAIHSNETNLLVIAEKLKDQNGDFSAIQIKHE